MKEVKFVCEFYYIQLNSSRWYAKLFRATWKHFQHFIELYEGISRRIVNGYA